MLGNEAVQNEAVLTARSMSKIFPIVVNNCKEIDEQIALEISELFEEYMES